MHDIDRTQLEYGQQAEFETDEFEFEQEWSGEADEFEAVLGEAEEAEFASELLEVTTEQELDQFLGSLLSRAASAVGSVAQGTIRTVSGSGRRNMSESDGEVSS